MSEREITEAVWVTRPRVSVAHIRGLLEGLEQEGALAYASLRIIVLQPGEGGEVFGRVIPEEMLPAQGVLVTPEGSAP